MIAAHHQTPNKLRLASGMSEEAARAVIALSQSISNGEDNRERLLVQISQLTGTMANLNEAFGR
jgi:hypothetical protein